MNKKVLVLTLALVVAFAGSAMAEVKFSGKFTATAEQDSFKVFKDEFKLTSGLEFNISATNKNTTETTKLVEKTEVDAETGEEVTVIESVTESYTNWDFTGGIAQDGDKWKLGKYKLELNDQYFQAWVWGNKQDLSDKKSYFDMIVAGKASGDGAMRARILVPVMDLAKVTVDFEAKDNARFFVEGEVEGFNVGLSYARTGWTDENTLKNVLVGQVGTELPAGDFVIDTKAALGVTLGDDLGFALGLSGETNVTEEVEVDARVKFRNEQWAGGGFAAALDNTKATVLGAGATYEVSNLQVSGDIEQTLVTDNNSNVIELGAKYRMGTKVAYDKLFNAGTGAKWYSNDAPAFGVDVKFVDLKFDNVVAKVAAPVVDNMVWAMASGKYEGDSKFEAKAYGHVVATNKLTLTQEVGYKSTDKAFDVKLGATYKIGLSDTTIGFKAEKVFNETKDGKELLQASVTVPF